MTKGVLRPIGVAVGLEILLLALIPGVVLTAAAGAVTVNARLNPIHSPQGVEDFWVFGLFIFSTFAIIASIQGAVVGVLVVYSASRFRGRSLYMISAVAAAITHAIFLPLLFVADRFVIPEDIFPGAINTAAIVSIFVALVVGPATARFSAEK